ncbi:MAG TPA: hypothetical protein VG937_02040 [Polyangiaceae bacterium]|nr:hypothetical protein [Polyangiaceae bacterium]
MTEADSDSSEKPAAEAAAPKAEPGEASADAPAEPSVAPDAEPKAEPSEAEPVKKKKGKKKKKSAVSEARPERDAEGRDRPTFLLDFPHDPELESLITAFEIGNYARVRELAPRLIERSDRAEVKAAAQELLDRIDPDPLVKFLLAVAVALFVAVVVITYHSHG